MTWAEVPRSPGHVFYDRLRDVLIAGGFDRFVETACQPYYAPKLGAPSVPPGRYFRMHMVGYFEGIASERGIAWRCSDSLALRDFLRLESREAVPDHSWLSKTRGRLPHELHETVFGWVLKLVAEPLPFRAPEQLKSCHRTVSCSDVNTSACIAAYPARSIRRSQGGPPRRETIKDKHLKDIALQTYVIAGTGLELANDYLLFINNQYVREDEVDWNGLFCREDVSVHLIPLLPEMPERIASMHEVLYSTEAPDIRPSRH